MLVKVRNAKQIKKTLNSSGYTSAGSYGVTSSIYFNPEMEKLCGKFIDISTNLERYGYPGADWNWHPSWLIWPKGQKPKVVKIKKYRAGILINNYEVEIGNSIKIGCQRLTTTQETLWFKILGKRLGYEIKG